MKSWIGQLVCVLCLTQVLTAQMIEDFSSRPQMNIYQAQERGCGFEVIASPLDNAAMVGSFTWQDVHAAFLEYYYAKDPAIPGTGKSAQGKLTVTAYAQQGDAIRGLALRVKDASGEIHHIQQNFKPQNAQWTNVVFTLGDKPTPGHWGGNNDGILDCPLKLTGYAWVIDKQAKAGSVMLGQLSWQGVEAAIAPAVAPKPSPMDQYPLEQAHLFEPLWSGKVMYDESVALVKEPDAEYADGTLLFVPTKVLRVCSSDEKTVYEQGRDYTLDAAGKRIVLTGDSRIASITREELYKNPNEKRAIRSKLGDESKWLLYAENWFRTIQVKVTYEHAHPWQGYVPRNAGSQLPRVTSLIKTGKELTMCIIGDSISSGANASGRSSAPHMPPYGILVQRAIMQKTGSKVELLNLAVAGTTSDGALKVIPRIGEAKPDLFIIAYGMNDVASRKPQKYRENLETLIQTLKQSYPQAEYILVSSSLANPQWTWSRADMFEPYRQELVALVQQNTTGCAMADGTALWTDLLKTKRYLDLTGNGINHPNDFGHRLYAQILLSLLIEE